ncbi:extracellular calcium-sensing receptor-like [Protopterus annectens]|uniref:extracellular calcium-sensing receptor-like n=1 Tax=Protopterus annectens TaxID=7888 RepID=UPI001CFB059B|nr:extracellular calcium-sensing receptor-like [Protopterus annectens]
MTNDMREVNHTENDKFKKLISPGAMHPALSDKLQFPSFLRTLTSNKFQNYALAQLIRRFGWTWVGLLTEDSDLGEIGCQYLKDEIQKSGGCIAFLEKLNVLYSKDTFIQVTKVIQRSSANVVIVNSDEVHIKPLLDALYLEKVIGKVLVLTVICIITPGFYTKETWKLLNGTIGLVPYSADIPGFKDFLFSLHPLTSKNDIFIKSFWEIAFDCMWLVNGSKQERDSENTKGKLCTGLENLEEQGMLIFELNDMSYTYQVYLAVYAFAHALNDLVLCKLGSGLFLNNSCTNIKDIQPWQVLHYLKNIHFTMHTGEEVYFDLKGDTVAMYDIINVQITADENFKFVKVGRVYPRGAKGEEIRINITSILWNEKYNQVPKSVCSDPCLVGYRMIMRKGQPTCCFDCIPCSSGEIANETDTVECMKCQEDQWPNDRHDKCIPKIFEFLTYEEPLGTSLAAISILLSIITAFILYIFINFRHTPIVKANNRELSYLLLLALMFCFLSALIFIGQPVKVTCMLRQTVFGVVFSVSVSCVLAKTITVVIAFKATNPHSNLRQWVGHKVPHSVVFVCSLIQIIICTAWLVYSSPSPQFNVQSNSRIRILECDEGQRAFFYCMIGYMGILAIVSFIVAFLARKLPDSFNEAKHITFSMLVFVSVWLSFIPAYLSTQGKYMVAVEIFAMLSSSAGLLCCIFCYKCYIILLQPHKNSKQYLTSKGPQSR